MPSKYYLTIILIFYKNYNDYIITGINKLNKLSKLNLTNKSLHTTVFLCILFLIFKGCAPKGITKQEVDKLLINKLVDDLIFTASQAIKWNNDLLLADKVLNVSKNPKIKSIRFLTENNKVWVSNDLSEFGQKIQIDFKQYTDNGEYLIKRSKKKLSVIKSFVYEDKKNNLKKKYYIFMDLLIENNEFVY